tara:strand:- start:2842 stop:4092 length:1251 start_codon:yes stop_codon:yes gene_type:complete
MADLKVSIDYFNDEHQKLFEAYPNAADIEALVINGANISKEEFLGYMMFKDQLDRVGHKTYNELSARIQHRLGDIDDYLTFGNGSVQAQIIGGDLHQTGLTERVGIALGLCVVNQIHGLTQADWEKIPEAPGRGGHPTFDFEIPVASTGSNFIQAENKGSAVQDNSDQRGTVDSHYKGILRKKKYLRGEEAKLNIPLHDNLYYGTIGVLDNQTNSTAKVWLVDPPAFNIEMGPRKYKLVSRLTYYLEEFKEIGLKTKILEALENRIKEIIASKDYSSFDNKSLDDNYPAQGTYYLYMEGNNSLALVDTNEAFGRVFLIERKQRTVPYLIAFPKALMRIIIKQNFEQILNYKYDPDFMRENVQVLMRFTKGDMLERNISEVLKFTFNEKKRSSEAVYFGKLNFSSDGKIFGMLDNER